MLDDLATFASQNGMTFLYGEREAFNIDADKSDPYLPTLYHTGYISAAISEDAQGVFYYNYSLKLNLLLPSLQGDTPTVRQPRFAALTVLCSQLLAYLDKKYTLSGMNVLEGINQTDRNLDGLQLTLSARPKLPIGVC